MSPTLRPGVVVLAVRRDGNYKVGNIIIMRHDGLDKIKRLTNMRIVNDKVEFFLVGDNTADSVDSRHFGWLAAEDILGAVIWPRVNKNTQKYPISQKISD